MSTSRRYALKQRPALSAPSALRLVFGTPKICMEPRRSFYSSPRTGPASGAVQCRTVWNSYSPPQRVMIQKDLTSCSHGTPQRRTRKGLKLVRRKH